MHPSEFDQLVEEAFGRIPIRFRRHLRNVVIVVETGRDMSLLGLYESGAFGLPDRITLYQRSIERASRSRADIPRVIAETLWHEVAHYFGMDERQVRSAERRRIIRSRGRLR